MGFGSKGIFGARGLAGMAGLAWVGLSAVPLAALAAQAAEDVVPVLLQTSEAVFSRPHDLVLNPGGRYLLVADTYNDRILLLKLP